MGRQQKKKPKFDKERCLKCKYHGSGYNLGWLCCIGHRNMYIYCNYCCATDSSTLTLDEHKNVIDRRGENYHNCLLFEEGEPKRDRGMISLKGSHEHY